MNLFHTFSAEVLYSFAKEKGAHMPLVNLKALNTKNENF